MLLRKRRDVSVSVTKSLPRNQQDSVDCALAHFARLAQATGWSMGDQRHAAGESAATRRAVLFHSADAPVGRWLGVGSLSRMCDAALLHSPCATVMHARVHPSLAYMSPSDAWQSHAESR